MRDRVNGAGERYAECEIVGDALRTHGIGSANCGFADDGRSLEDVEIVGELVASGESILGGLNKAGLPSRRLGRSKTVR
jgi:hypothetical protein